MSDVAAYHVLFPVQGGVWTGQSTHLPALETTHTQIHLCCHITHNKGWLTIL